jgi:hypothetical protein
MKKLLAVALVLALLLASWIAPGPWLAVGAIKDALREQDSTALAAQVDFPALRASLKHQLADRLVRSAGAEVQSSALGAIGLRMATGASSMAVDATVNPAGLAALMEGRAIWRKVGDDFAPPAGDDTSREPLRDASYRYESPSRFSITVHDASGAPLVFILTRQGLRWRLTDVRLPR